MGEPEIYDTPPWDKPPKRLSAFPKEQREPLIGQGAVILEPHLAALLARCLAQWSVCEGELGLFLVRLLGAEARAGLAMFSSLRSSQAQKDAIEAAASVTFPAEHKALLNGVLSFVTRARKRRNALAHYLWMRNAHIPNALILMNPSDMLDYAVNFERFTDDTKGMEPAQAIKLAPNIDFNRIDVYFDEDFTNLHRGFSSCRGCIRRLTNLVGSEGSQRDEVVASLKIMLRDPHIVGSQGASQGNPL